MGHGHYAFRVRPNQPTATPSANASTRNNQISSIRLEKSISNLSNLISRPHRSGHRHAAFEPGILTGS